MRMAHLDTAPPPPLPAAPAAGGGPSGSGTWLALVCRWPAEAMGLQPLPSAAAKPATAAAPKAKAAATAQIRAGAPLSCVALDARSTSELFARPHADRAVVVDGRMVSTQLPAFSELDELNAVPTEMPWAELAGTVVSRGGAGGAV